MVTIPPTGISVTRGTFFPVGPRLKDETSGVIPVVNFPSRVAGRSMVGTIVPHTPCTHPLIPEGEPCGNDEGTCSDSKWV